MIDFFTSSGVVASDRELYTASTFARSSLLHLQEIGRLTALRPHVSSRVGLSSLLFVVVESGSGTLTYAGGEHELGPDSCAFIDCRRPYRHQTDEQDLWTIRWCHFFGPTASAIYDKYRERGGRPAFAPASTEEMRGLLDQLTATARSSDYMRDMLINEQLARLLRLVMEQSWHPEDKVLPSKRASVMEVRQYLDEHYAERIALDELAASFFISKYYLAHSFKEQFGVTINAYLQSVRVTHAKQLLRFTGKTIDEIAAEVGLPDPAYFSRLFKKVEGVAPSAYREQW